jgi:PAS domain S-box-containing protein
MNQKVDDAKEKGLGLSEPLDQIGESLRLDAALSTDLENARHLGKLLARQLELEETVERLTLVLESTQYGFWDWNCATNEVYYSPQWARLLEYEPSEVEPNAAFFLNLVHPDDFQRVMSSIERHFANLEPWKQLEVRLRTKSGGYRWFLDRGKLVNRDESGRPLRMVGTLTDITNAKNDQSLIEEKERRLRESQRIAKLGSFHWNALTNGVTWSDELFRIYDKDPLQFTPTFEGYMECVRLEDRPRVLQGLEQAMTTLGVFDHEYLVNGKPEKPCWIQARGRAIVGGDGKLEGLEGTCQDITERKIAEVRMMEAKDRLERVASRVPGMVYEFRMSPDGMFSFPYASPGMRTIFQIAPSDVREDGDLIFSLIHPEDLAILEVSIKESALKMSVWSHEFRLLLPDGTIRWIAGSSAPTLEQDGSTLWYGYLTDITDRKNSEMAIRFSEAKFRAIINASPVPMALCDDQEQLSYKNLSFVDTFGYSADEIMDLPTWRQRAYPCAIYRKWVMETWQTHFLRAKQTGANFEPIELKVRCKDGSTKLVAASATPILEGQSGLHLLQAQDITERNESEQKLIQAHAAAEAASRAKSEFLANMSHEIRTPLTAMLGFAELLGEASSYSDTFQRERIVDTIKNAGNHLLTIINDVLDLSKIEANRMTIEQVETPLLGVLREIETLMLPNAKGKGVDLRVVLASRVPDRILCDPTRLRQIIMNLVGNSVKFSEAGCVTIQAGVLTSDSGGEMVTIDVQDTGPGVSREQIDRLFMPFGQGDSSTTRNHGGTGLGLTLSRRFARLLGGDVILLENVIGKGACFRLQFPLVAVSGCDWVTEFHPAGLEKSRLEGRKELKKIELVGRILLAEDGIDNQRLISFILRNAGASVETSDNGQIALEMIHLAENAGTPFDLLVSDMQMPEMDGYSLARTLREEGSKLPILALTANAMSYDERKCLEAGCDDYAMKPIDKKVFLSKCAALLQKLNSGSP